MFALVHPVAGAANTVICAYHWYGANRNQLWTQAVNLGKDIWMTEHYDNDQSLDASLATGVEIHKQLTINMANAYVWWWVREPSCNIIGPNASYINPRGYVLAQFAKFVRPGSIRVDATAGASSTYITAYKNAGKLVIVAINTGTKAVIQAFSINNGTDTSVSSYVTSCSKSMHPGAV